MVKSKTSITYYFVVIGLLLLHITVSFTSDYMTSNQLDIVFTFVSQIVIMLGLPVASYFLFIKPKSSLTDFKQDFGIRAFKKGELGKVVLLGLIAIYLNTVFAQINFGVLSLMGYNYLSYSSHDYVANIGWFFADIILTAIFPAICEETAHRGLFRLQYQANPAKYVLMSSMFFALMHQNAQQVIYTFLTGILFSTAVLFTGNLKTGMIMHFMVNVTEVFADLGMQTNNVFLALKSVLFNLLLSNIVGKVFMVLITLVLILAYIRLLASFKGKGFNSEKVKRMLKDGSLNFSNEMLPPLTKGERVLNSTFMLVTCMVGVVITLFTLVWGIMR